MQRPIGVHGGWQYRRSGVCEVVEVEKHKRLLNAVERVQIEGKLSRLSELGEEVRDLVLSLNVAHGDVILFCSFGIDPVFFLQPTSVQCVDFFLVPAVFRGGEDPLHVPPVFSDAPIGYFAPMARFILDFLDQPRPCFLFRHESLLPPSHPLLPAPKGMSAYREDIVTGQGSWTRDALCRAPNAEVVRRLNRQATHNIRMAECICDIIFPHLIRDVRKLIAFFICAPPHGRIGHGEPPSLKGRFFYPQKAKKKALVFGAKKKKTKKKAVAKKRGRTP